MSKRENEKVIHELGIVERSKGTTEIGKHAAEHGNASTVIAMGLKYPGLKQQTASDFKSAYSRLKKSKKAADSDITKTVQKKTGRPTLLSKNLMKKVI